MKKNFILVAILLAVGVVNAASFLDEMDNTAELRIDNLEMLAEGEVRYYDKWGLAWDTKLRHCQQPDGQILNRPKCVRGLGVYCEDETCPDGTKKES